MVLWRRKAGSPANVGQAGPIAPLRLERGGGAHRRPFGLGDDAEEVLDADHAHVGDAGDRRLIHGEQLRAHAGRPDHAAVQHAGQFEIVDEGLGARAFAGDVGARERLADDAVRRGVLQRDFGVDLESEALAADQFADRDAVAAGLGPHLAACQDQFGCGPLQPFGAESHELLAGRRRGLPNADAALCQARTAAGSALVGRQQRVALDEVDLLDRQSEFLGGHLADGDAQSGSEVHFAGEDRGGSIGMNGEEAIDLRAVHGLAGKLRGCRCAAARAARRETSRRRRSGRRRCAGYRAGIRCSCGPPGVTRRAKHRADDPGVRAAAAEASGESLFDLLGGGLRRAIQQRLGGHDHAVGAVPALGRLFGDEGGLQPVRLLGSAEAFERRDRLAGGFADRSHTGPHRLTVHDHRAGAALAEPAAEFRSR